MWTINNIQTKKPTPQRKPSIPKKNSLSSIGTQDQAKLDLKVQNLKSCLKQQQSQTASRWKDQEPVKPPQQIQLQKTQSLIEKPRPASTKVMRPAIIQNVPSFKQHQKKDICVEADIKFQITDNISCWQCYKVVPHHQSTKEYNKVFCGQKCKEKYCEEISVSCVKCKTQMNKEQGILKFAEWYCSIDCFPSEEEYFINKYLQIIHANRQINEQMKFHYFFNFSQWNKNINISQSPNLDPFILYYVDLSQ